LRRSIPVAELAEDEPGEGGLFFHDAVEEWGEVRPDWMDRAGIPPNAPLATELFLREQHNWRAKNFTYRWNQGEFVAFGFPLHDAQATCRVRIPTVLRDRLVFTRRGDARDDLSFRPSPDGSAGLDVFVRPGGVRHFREVLFYQREIVEAAARKPTQGIRLLFRDDWHEDVAAAARKLTKKQRVLAAMDRRADQLNGLSERAKAQLLAKDAGCSEPYARAILAEQRRP
jgi:hypothetical protein